MSRFMKKYKMFMRGMDGASLERAFAARFNQMDILEENSRNHMEEIRKIKEVQNITLNKVAIVKYDAFKEMGWKAQFCPGHAGQGKQWFRHERHPQQRRLLYLCEGDCEGRILCGSRRGGEGSSPPGRELPQRTGAVKP